MRRVGVAAIVASLVVLSYPLVEAQKELITLDVVVTDAKSRPITDLRAADLELSDAGESRTVDTVRLQAGGGRSIGIFLDEFHVRAGEATVRARAALTQFVGTLRDDDLVALVMPRSAPHPITFTHEC